MATNVRKLKQYQKLASDWSADLNYFCSFGVIGPVDFKRRLKCKWFIVEGDGTLNIEPSEKAN
jgi:hypothetical protein